MIANWELRKKKKPEIFHVTDLLSLHLSLFGSHKKAYWVKENEFSLDSLAKIKRNVKVH